VKEMLEKIKNEIPNMDRNSRITDLENGYAYLEAKVKKIEAIIKEIPANFVIPKKLEKIVNSDVCKKCQNIDKHWSGVIESMKIKNKTLTDKMTEDNRNYRFLLQRVVAVYGNKALIDLLNHVENPEQLTSERIEQLKNIRPQY